jgi:hypothetical protein
MTDEGLHSRDNESVTIGHVADLYALLRALDETMPPDAILYLEGTSFAPEIRDFLSSRHAPQSREVAPGTILPRPETFHLPLTGTNLADLRALAEQHAEPEVTDHLAVYRRDELLLSAYDAGDGDVQVARTLPEQTIGRLRLALGDALRGHR